MSILRAVGWLSAAVAAAATYAVLARRVRRGEVDGRDAEVRRAVLAQASPPLRRVASATGHLGKWYTHVPLAAAGAVALVATRRPAAAGAIAGASLAAVAAVRLLERVHDQRVPPPGKRRIDPTDQSFPSGHAFETTAVMLAAAWVLAREKLVRPAIGAPVAVLASLVSGLGRLLLDRHWSSDSAAGYAGGVAVGAAAVGAYELLN